MGKPLTPQAFDRMMEASSTNQSDNEAEILWGAKEIGRFIGRSPDYVRDTLAKADGSPIKRQGREYFAFRPALLAWLEAA